MTGKRLVINLYGACVVRAAAPGTVEITGAKHKALFALLATAPMGRRTRAFVQETLWGVGDYEAGRQNLRRAIADIKQAMGPLFAEVLEATPTDLILDLGKIEFLGGPEAGDFLEGIEVRTPLFLRWLEDMRRRAAAQAAPPLAGEAKPNAEVLPTIAVIPFRAVGDGAADNAVVGDWLAEEVTRALGRSHLMNVIAHLSARELAGPSIAVGDVKGRLAAGFCLAGTLRRQGDRLVLDADLIDCGSGRMLWTRQHTLPAARPFEAGLEAAGDLVRAVGRAIAEDSIRISAGLPPREVEDQRLVVAGVGLMHRAALRDFARARQLLEEAARRAPRRAELHAWLGKWYVLCVFNHWSADVRADTQRALDCTARALDLAPDNSFCLTIDGFAQTNLMKRLDLAEQRYDLALEHNPNEALSWLLKGTRLAFIDDSEGAVAATSKARRLSPIDPFGYFYDVLSAGAMFAAGNYDDALRLAQKAMVVNDRHLSTFRIAIAALHHLGRTDEARTSAMEMMKRHTEFRIDSYVLSHPAAKNTAGRKVIEALLAAGIR
jgi:TolB-like protein